MSYDLDGTDDYLSGTAADVPNDVGSFLVWFKPDFAENYSGSAHFWFSVEPAGYKTLYMPGAFSNFRKDFDGWQRDDTIDTAWAVAGWQALVLTWDKSGPTVTAQIDSETVSVGTPSGTWGSTAEGTNWFLGKYTDASGYFDGRLAHVAFWSTVLSSGNRTSLLGGANPLAISAGTLVSYWPLTGDATSAVGDADLSVTGATLQAGDNPTVDPPPTPGEAGVKLNSYRRRRVSL